MMKRSARLLLVVLAGVLVMLAAPPAGASTGDYDVVPVLNCVRDNPDGTYTAVLGYVNSTGRAVSIPIGSDNQITPVSKDKGQPTSFSSGELKGVFAITAPDKSQFVWHLDATNLKIRSSATPACSASTQLSADGNGTGVVVGLLAAAGVGLLVVRRVVRRSRGIAGGTPAAGPVPGDA
jgi:hypothetical protein